MRGVDRFDAGVKLMQALLYPRSTRLHLPSAQSHQNHVLRRLKPTEYSEQHGPVVVEKKIHRRQVALTPRDPITVSKLQT